MIIIYTDGSCDNSLNKTRVGAREGGWGAVINLPDKSKRELSIGTYYNTSSARMELRAVIAVLGIYKGKGIPITIFSDNKYVIDAFSEGWVFNWERTKWKKKGKMRENHDLWKRFLIHFREMHENGIELKLNWIKGHDGHPDNERADFLANNARKKRVDMIPDGDPWR
jgi:ribonuclease HI